MPQFAFWVRGNEANMVRDLAKLYDGNESMAVRVAVKEAWERKIKNGNGVKLG